MVKNVTKKSISIPIPPPLPVTSHGAPSVRRLPWRWVVAALVLLFLILLTANKGWVVIAIVDGTPIFSWQLNSVLRTRYGQQTLEGMIGEALIEKEARRSGIVISPDDLKAKQDEILSSLGTEVSLSDFLKFQGMSESDFHKQLSVQLTVERLLTKDLTITEKDVDNFIATNRALLVSTDAAHLREEAKKTIISNTVSEQIQSWFTQLRKDAKVVKFL